MSRSKTFDVLKATRQEVSVSKHVPITHLNSPTIFEASNSMIGMVLKLEGVTFDAESDEVLNQYKRTWHQALTMLDDRFAVYYTTHRHKESVSLTGEFDNEFCRSLDANYHEQFRNCNMYVNDLYITVVYKGVTSGKAGKGIKIFNWLFNKAVKQARASARQVQIKALTQAVDQLKATLSPFKPVLVGSQDEALGYSELISFLSLQVNAGDALTSPYMTKTPVIANSLPEAKKQHHLYPQGKLSQFLTRKRIFFGEYIQFQGAVSNDVKFAAMISIKHYGKQTASIMFDTLLHLDSDFLVTHTFAIEPKDVSLDRIEKQRNKLINSGDKAYSEVGDFNALDDMVASERLSVGFHHNTVMLIADTKEMLEKQIVECIKCYADAGFVAIRETLGQEPAFWAQIPTNFKYIARSCIVTSENFVDFVSLHNYRTGFIDENHLGSAVTIFETPSKTPYRFNFHAKGSKDNPSKGHTIIIGGNGSGKTAFMAFTDAQENRYGGNSIVFDRDRGQEIYVRAKGGSYAILSPDHPTSSCFSPLQLPDSKENRQFNRDLLIQLCKENELDELTASEVSQLTDCVNYAYDDLSDEHRTLTNATNMLPIDFTRWPALGRWLRSTNGADGEYAYLFDNAHDQLAMQKHMGFDMTHFLDNEPAHIRTALMMYFFQRITLSLKEGVLTRVDLDEAWQYFQDPYWEEKLKRVLPTWRKKNAQLVMATQSPSSVVNSNLKNVILDNVATQIYFANPSAKKEYYIDGLNLTDTEYSIIRDNTPQSRLFLVKQEHESLICRLNLSHMPEVLAVLSGNTKTVNLLDQIREEVGDDPAAWLPLFHEKRVRLRA